MPHDDQPDEAWCWLEIFPGFAQLCENNARTRKLLARPQQQIELSIGLLDQKVPQTRPSAGFIGAELHPLGKQAANAAS
jgi:hypothetical protein